MSNINISLPAELVVQLIAALTTANTGSPAVVTPPPAVVEVPEGFVYMPLTKHILPKPKAEQNSFWGYMIDAAAAAGGGPGERGPQRAGRAVDEYAFAKNVTQAQALADRNNWPEILDRHYNWETYATPQEIAARRAQEEAAKTQWDAHWAAKEKNKNNPPADTPIQL